MTPLKRRVAAVSAPLLLALSLTACGGGADGAPDDASSDDFCKAIMDEPDGFSSDDDGEAVDAAHEFADNLKDVGTPDDMSDEERNGFEAFVDFAADVDEDDAKDLENADQDDVFGDDSDDVDAFFEYVAKTCAPDVPDVPTDIPTDIPT